jgi:hypothetical protein
MPSVTLDRISEMLDDTPALKTIRDQYSLTEIWELLEGKDADMDDEDLFNALMDVQYATRPKGVL